MVQVVTVRDREAGNVIECFDSVSAAAEAVRSYEDCDKKDGIFVEGFYEIVKNEHAAALGAIKSDKKASAARKNGKKGGFDSSRLCLVF